jgi:hypothetical protein
MIRKTVTREELLETCRAGRITNNRGRLVKIVLSKDGIFYDPTDENFDEHGEPDCLCVTSVYAICMTSDEFNNHDPETMALIVERTETRLEAEDGDFD